MTIPLAVLWSVLASASWISLAYVTLLIRPGAATDLVNIQGCMAVAFLLAIWFMARVHAGQHTLSDFLGLRRTHPLLYILAAALGLAMTLPAEVIHRAVERRWPTPPEALLEQMAAFRMDTSLRRILIPFAVIAVGPVIEELFFRGALHRGLRRGHPDATVVPFLALLFAAAHQDLRSLLPLFLVGLVLGLLRASSGSLLTPLIAHVFFNAVGVFELLRAGGDLETDTTPLPLRWSLGGLAATAALVAGFVLIARRSTRAQQARQEDSS